MGTEPLIRTRTIALSDALSRAATELRRMETQGRALEDRVGAHVTAGTQTIQDLHVALQGLDHMVQSLDAVAGYLDRLAQGAPPQLRVDIDHAVAAIRLRDLSNALAGHTPAERVRSGDVDLF